MAKLSAHGTELGRIYYTTSVKAYFLDGKILENKGFGWKLKGKLKEGVDAREHFARVVAKQKEFEASRPALVNYRRKLRDLCGIGKAWKLHMAIDLMPNDPDGVWSEACDGYGDNVHADVDEIVDLCAAYGAAILEAKALEAKETVCA